MEGKLLSIDEVAGYLDVHRDTVYALVRSGQLPALQLGGRKGAWRITEDDLAQFVTQRRTESQENVNGSQGRDREVAAFDERQEAELQAFRDAQREQRQRFLDWKA